MRLVTGHEVARWQTLMDPDHYLGFPGFVGERLYQVAVWPVLTHEPPHARAERDIEKIFSIMALDVSFGV